MFWIFTVVELFPPPFAGGCWYPLLDFEQEAKATITALMVIAITNFLSFIKKDLRFKRWLISMIFILTNLGYNSVFLITILDLADVY